jgi:hypothetical protein
LAAQQEPWPSRLPSSFELEKLMRRKVEHLEIALTTELNITGEGASIVRGLINQIRLHPRQRREAMPIEVYGEPAALFLSAGGDSPKSIDRLITVVAEEGLEPPTRGL